MSEVGYIDLLIESEKHEKKEGYSDRISSLQEIRKEAELMTEVTSCDSNSVPIINYVSTETASQPAKKPGWCQQLLGLFKKKQ